MINLSRIACWLFGCRWVTYWCSTTDHPELFKVEYCKRGCRNTSRGIVNHHTAHGIIKVDKFENRSSND